MHKRPENEDIERVQNYGMRITLSQPPRTPSKRLRDKLKWMTLEKRREMRRLAPVQRCVMKEAPHCLNERLAATADFAWESSDKTIIKLVQSGTIKFTCKGSQE